jgi:hypothetical protein
MSGNPLDMIVEDLSHHCAYARIFQPGSLTIGFIAPLEG